MGEPLFYLLYINYIEKIGVKGNHTIYPEDTVIVYNGEVESTIMDDKNNIILDIKKPYVIFKQRNKSIID